ncbi:cyclase family protein [Melghirimyces algeriensis]|uniref:Kynurenine formamidase n=1 Tax=Melghirimyces algeriensis TaxID=910412 RepID=A0A521FFI4_9BACL|nr:cyclase family protein [Melghirimyces algeriensis]SMO94310.1 Kynurenine formamidase [Melghirimyces algeriensis]
MDTVERNGKRITLIDLSDQLNNATRPYELNPHEIEYSKHEESVAVTENLLGIGKEHWQDGFGWAVEEVTLSTHSGTHVDAPYHYGPVSEAKPARTIDQVPLHWCYGSGVVLDMRHKAIGDKISDVDVQKELDRIQYTIQPYDIILVHTGSSKYFGTPDYAFKQPGMTKSAVEWLLEQGVKVIGIDAWGLDRPFDQMAREAREGKTQFWEAHLVGREKEYCQIEKLCNLDQIPIPFGFQVCAFPINIADASGGWSRVVAILEEEIS